MDGRTYHTTEEKTLLGSVRVGSSRRECAPTETRRDETRRGEARRVDVCVFVLLSLVKESTVESDSTTTTDDGAFSTNATIE